MKFNKLIIGILLIVSIFCLSGVSMAASIDQGYQTPLKGVNTQTTLLSGHGEVITGMVVTASGTAQTVGLFDTASTATIATTNGVIETQVPANTSQYFDFHTRPIRVTTGLSLFTSRTDGSVTVYTQK